jgi:hypothetical protein
MVVREATPLVQRQWRSRHQRLQWVPAELRCNLSLVRQPGHSGTEG